MTARPFETDPRLGTQQSEPKKQPVVIRKDRCRIEIYDIASFMHADIDTRGLWKVMFSAPWQNEETIAAIRRWLPDMGYETKTLAVELAERLNVEQADVRHAESRLAAFGGADYGKAQKEQLKLLKEAHLDAKRAMRYTERLLRETNADYARVMKLQILFNTMAEKAGL